MEVLHEEREQDAEEQAGDDGERDVEREVGRDGPQLDLGAVDDADRRLGHLEVDALVVEAGLERDAALLERVEVLAEALVLDRRAGRDGALLLLEGAQLRLVELRLAVGLLPGLLDARLDAFDLLGDRRLDGREQRLGLHDLRVVVAEVGLLERGHLQVELLLFGDGLGEVLRRLGHEDGQRRGGLGGGEADDPLVAGLLDLGLDGGLVGAGVGVEDEPAEVLGAVVAGGGDGDVVELAEGGELVLLFGDLLAERGDFGAEAGERVLDVGHVLAADVVAEDLGDGVRDDLRVLGGLALGLVEAHLDAGVLEALALLLWLGAL